MIIAFACDDTLRIENVKGDFAQAAICFPRIALQFADAPRISTFGMGAFHDVTGTPSAN
ncbi:MAG TPA: hypothetical protein VK642_14525 [Burkholderiales bacterium]|nr:hypothetical protein [Burkholderiales bacterium]